MAVSRSRGRNTPGYTGNKIQSGCSSLTEGIGLHGMDKYPSSLGHTLPSSHHEIPKSVVQIFKMAAKKASSLDETDSGNMDTQPEKTSVPDDNPSDDFQTQSDSTPVAQDLPAWKVFIIWLAISLGVLCTFLDEGIIATAIPKITDEFRSLADVGVSKLLE